MTRALRWTIAAAAAAAGLMLGASALAVPIVDYSLTALPIPGNYYQYQYTVTNDGSLPGAAPIVLFDVEFDPALYNQLSLAVQSPDGWNGEVLQLAPDVSPVADWLALIGGVAPGETVTGFTVDFQWLGSDLPGAQTFLIYDPDTFDVLADGTTTFREQSVPEPGSMLLAGIALAAFALSSLRRKRTRRLVSRGSR